MPRQHIAATWAKRNTTAAECCDLGEAKHHGAGSQRPGGRTPRWSRRWPRRGDLKLRYESCWQTERGRRLRHEALQGAVHLTLEVVHLPSLQDSDSLGGQRAGAPRGPAQRRFVIASHRQLRELLQCVDHPGVICSIDGRPAAARRVLTTSCARTPLRSSSRPARIVVRDR